MHHLSLGPPMNLHDRYQKVLDNIAAAAAKGRRNAADVTLIAVTKKTSLESIKQLVEYGHRDFGESKVQELQQRAAQLDEWLSRQQHRPASAVKEKALPG